MTKRFLSLFLALCMVMLCVPSVFAAEADDTASSEAVENSVVNDADATYVAKIGTSYYRTLLQASQYAKANDTIELLEPNVVLNETVVLENNVALTIPENTSLRITGSGRLTVLGQLNVYGDVFAVDKAFLDATYGQVTVWGNMVLGGQQNINGRVVIGNTGRVLSDNNVSGYLADHARTTDAMATRYENVVYAYAWVNKNVVQPTEPPQQTVDAKLGGLSISSGKLSPTFATNTFVYNVEVENTTKSVWLLASAAQGLVIKVNGVVTASGVASDNISLSEGTNTIYVDVTREDGSQTARYTVNVTRKPEIVLTKYNVTVESVANGSFIVDPMACAEGTQVSIVGKPNSGYRTSGVAVVSNGKTVDVVKTGDNTYGFRMPKGNVIVSGTFSKVPLRFDDVKVGQWFYDSVIYATDKGWISGIGNNKFAPNDSMRRGDFCIMMARIDGANLDGYHVTRFKDVPDNSYYMKAIAYCADKGYVSGVGNGRFAPNATITREQMARIIANVKKLAPVNTPVKKFNDDAKISGWARPYIYACLNARILAGDNAGNVNPTQPARRAEAAAMLVRAFG